MENELLHYTIPATQKPHYWIYIEGKDIWNHWITSEQDPQEAYDGGYNEPIIAKINKNIKVHCGEENDIPSPKDEIDFRNTIWDEDVKFEGFVFKSQLSFEGSKFNKAASFMGAKFHNRALFAQSEFLGQSSFIVTTHPPTDQFHPLTPSE